MAVATAILAAAAVAGVVQGQDQARKQDRMAKKQRKEVAAQNQKFEADLAQQKSNEKIDKQNFLQQEAARRRSAAARSAPKSNQSAMGTAGVQTSGGGKTLLGS